MNESKEEVTMQLSNEQLQFLDLIKKDPMIVLNGMSRYDVIKPLVWKDRHFKSMSWQKLANKYNITISQVRTILKNIKNNS